MSSVIREYFDVLIAVAFVYVWQRVTGTPVTEIVAYMTFGYVVLLNSRSRKS